MNRILAINPGSTSTKFAVYHDSECILHKTIRHPMDELMRYENVIDQFDFRKGLIINELIEEGVAVDSLKIIIGRGGLSYPLQSGVYKVNNRMLDHVRKGVLGQHASNLGPLLADYIALQIPGACAYIADPVVTDELSDVARIAGHPRFERVSIFHALNQKATARLHARKFGKKYEEMRLIVAHLGGGITVGAHLGGKVIDVNNGFDGEGPFSPERSGTLPAGQLIDLCFSGRFSKDQIRRMVVGEGGYVGYLGTNDAKEVEQMAASGNKNAFLIQEALFYQVSKSIGQMAVVLKGQLDGILLTGGMTFSRHLVNSIREMVSFLGPVYDYPGEDELDALAMNALLAANGEVEVKEYDK